MLFERVQKKRKADLNNAHHDKTATKLLTYFIPEVMMLFRNVGRPGFKEWMKIVASKYAPHA